ncbi:nuclear transport factor 2 family protein [Winogradskyella sp. DF17]|uniref:Nuclear transport factor 2 family protein n=1 Tax=Winogradskyella pelagia TaxID=2819984 RepID=A0ABS3T3Q2_9FLAO|nr:nuclear transport factor 2 family protein [Winogradskyella sp. DF17]MBO3117381.1 nuclear transport factor 2 family protein [Winogradskyella sp. DF17]
MRYTLCLLTLVFVSTITCQELTEKVQIENTLNFYIDGFYKGDTTALKKALRPRLNKFGYWKNEDTGNYEYYAKMDYNDAMAFVQKMKDEGRTRDENEIRNVEVLDIGNHIASAKVTATWGVDYMTLSKDNGKWRIEQVIWEGPYEKAYVQKPTTYYLIRHAEKDLRNKSNRNPHLSEVGIARANNWAKIFGAAEFDMVYSTDYFRTKETAAPIAKANNLEVTLYDPRDFNPEDFKRKTNGKTVLIVGHSNTTPMLSNSFIKDKKYQQISEDVYGNVYIVNLDKDNVNSILLSLD